MKRILSALSVLLCLCFATDAVAQDYANLSPLTLLNRSVLDKSRRAIERDDILTRDAQERLVRDADELMQKPIPTFALGDSKVLNTLGNEARMLGEAYYLTRQEKYAARVFDYIHLLVAQTPPSGVGGLIPSGAEGIIDMLDGYLLTEGSKAWNNADDEAVKQWCDALLQWLKSDEMRAKMVQMDDYQGLGYDMLLTFAKTFFEREWVHELKVYVDGTTKARLDRILAADGTMKIGNDNTLLEETEHLVTLVRMALVAEKAGSNLWLYEAKNGGSIRKSIEWMSKQLLRDKAWVKSNDVRSIARNYTYILLSAACPLTSKKLYDERLNTLASMVKGKEDISTLSYQLTTPIIYGTLLSDEDFFNVLNLDYPGLEGVKDDVASGNIGKAKTDFVAYLRHREYRFDWNNADNSKDNGGYDMTEVTNTVNNRLLDEQFGDTVIWTRNNTPLEYEEWPWGLSRHQYWIGLGRAYKDTGDEKYARAFVNQLNSWIDQSPLPDYDAKIDYSRWRTIETGIRTLGAWPMAYLSFLHSPSFDDESVFLMMKSFYEHAIHLRKHHRKNNWLSMEMNGLIHIALIFPEFKESAHWAEYAGTTIYHETEVQVYPDGAQVELTPGYHGATLSNFLGLYSIAKAIGYEGLPKNFSEKLENMYNYYVKIVAPTGEVPAVNDSGWNDARSSLAQGFGLFPERKDFQYIATDGKEGIMPSYTSTWMPWAGWYMMRSGWGENDLYSHFEVGPYSPGHQHEDKLSVILYAYGKRLITEGGTYSYDTSDWRKYILSARAHNISKVDGKYQNRHDYQPEEDLEYSREPMTNRWVSNDDCDFGEGWYDEGFGDEAGKADRNVEQYRALTFIKNKYWILFDVFTPKDVASHQYDTYFHFNTDKFVMNGNSVMSDDEGANIAIIPLRKDAKVDVVCGQTEPELQGWIPQWTKDGYVYNPVATPTFSYNEAGQSVSVYILYPLKSGEKNPIKSVKTKDGRVEVCFVNGEKDIITYSVEGKQLKTFSFKSKKKSFSILAPSPLAPSPCGKGRGERFCNARQYKHRLDDFAWENGSAIWRAYGPKLQSIGEKSYGYDVWTKNTSKLLMDERYLQDSIMEARCERFYDLGLDDKADSLKLVMSYHYDHGTGLDCYSVGSTLGCGAPALLTPDSSLIMPWCYESYEILEQTPEHVAFRLTYPQFELEGMTLQENRVISVDAGTRFCKSDVTFNLVGGEKKNIEGLRLAAGVVLHDEDRASLKMEKNRKGAFVAYADPTDRPEEDLGKVMIGLWMGNTDHEVETKIVQNHATLSVPYTVGQTVTYYFGSGWSKGDCPTLKKMIKELTQFEK